MTTETPVTRPLLSALESEPTSATLSPTTLSTSASPVAKGRPRPSAHVRHHPLDRSSWIEEVRYKDGFLALFLKPTPRSPQDRRWSPQPVALLYGPNVPSWVPGLIQAGEGGRSAGSAFNSILKVRREEMGIAYQKIEGKKKVQQLKEMMR